MGKRVKLYKCNAMVFDESKSKLLGGTQFNTLTNMITEYLFANSKTEATSIFENRYKNIVYVTISEMNISSGLVIYKNKYNSNIEDNELKLSMDSSDEKE